MARTSTRPHDATNGPSRNSNTGRETVKVQDSPFFKNLASSDDTTRAQAFDKLRTYLSARAPSLLTPKPSASISRQIPPPQPSLELLKLHKSLLSSLWLTPHARPQQQLARSIASLGRTCFAEQTGAGGFFEFLAAFWTVLCKEWVGIDSLRGDKYLWLGRFVVREGLEYCAQRVGGGVSGGSGGRRGGDGDGGEGGKGDGNIIGGQQEKSTERQRQGDEANDQDDDEHDPPTLHNRTLQSTVLHPTDPRIPNGLRYHVLDVYVDELERARETLLQARKHGKDPSEGPAAEEKADAAAIQSFLDKLLEPMHDLRTQSPTKTVRQRAAECLKDERLVEWGVGDISSKSRNGGGFKRKRSDQDEEQREKGEGEAGEFDGFD